MNGTEQITMTMERLNQYLDLRREVGILEEEVDSLREQVANPVSDTVTSSAEWPYMKHSVMVQGTDCIAKRKLERRMSRLQDRRISLQNELETIDLWVSSIQESVIRQILLLRYIRGLSWRGVANRMGGGNTEDSVRKKIERFMAE